MIEIAIIRKNTPVIQRGWHECEGCHFMATPKKKYCCALCQKKPDKHKLPLKTTHFVLEPMLPEQAVVRKEVV